MVRASVRAIIHSLTLVDYLPVQTHKPSSNYRLMHAKEPPLLSNNVPDRIIIVISIHSLDIFKKDSFCIFLSLHAAQLLWLARQKELKDLSKLGQGMRPFRKMILQSRKTKVQMKNNFLSMPSNNLPNILIIVFRSSEKLY